MTYDYKWAITERAMQEAEDKHGKDFYDLPEDVQNKLYTEATEAEGDNLMSRADALRDRMKETQ